MGLPTSEISKDTMATIILIMVILFPMTLLNILKTLFLFLESLWYLTKHIMNILPWLLSLGVIIQHLAILLFVHEYKYLPLNAIHVTSLS